MNRKNIFLTLALLFAVLLNASAQRVKFIEPKEDSSIEVQENHAKVIIKSNSADLNMTHSATQDKTIKTPNSDGTYSYMIDIAFDEYDDKFIKTVLELQLPGGKESHPLTMYRSKAYVGEFNEYFHDLSFAQNENEVLAKAKASRVAFFSELNNLNIKCNGIVCFANGKPTEQKGTNISLNIEVNNAGVKYNVEFSLDTEKGFKKMITHPVFEVSQGDSPGLSIDINEDLATKTVYNYQINSNVKVVEKEYTYNEIYVEAIEASKEGDFFKAMHAYERLLSHEDCPADKKVDLQQTYNKMKKGNKYMYIAESLLNKSRAKEKEFGFENDSVFIYGLTATKVYKKAANCSSNPNIFDSKIENILKKLQDHPLSKKIVQKTVHYQVITGVHPNGGGIPIYRSYTSDKIKVKSDELPLATTKSDGSFKLVFKSEKERPYALYFYGDKHSYVITEDTKEIQFD